MASRAHGLAKAGDNAKPATPIPEVEEEAEAEAAASELGTSSTRRSDDGAELETPGVMYEPLATGSHSADPAPYQARRTATAATAATASDSFAPVSHSGGGDGEAAAAPKKPFLARFGLDPLTLMLMFK